MKTEMPGIEKADFNPYATGIPDWLARHFEKQLAEARNITCPYKRRIAEIEIDMERDRVRMGGTCEQR